MTNEAWTLIISTSAAPEAEMLRGMLMENGIESVIINKKDSVYLFGEVEIYVKAEDALLARQLINPETL
jgi:hypothetical protein